MKNNVLSFGAVRAQVETCAGAKEKPHLQVKFERPVEFRLPIQSAPIHLLMRVRQKPVRRQILRHVRRTHAAYIHEANEAAGR